MLRPALAASLLALSVALAGCGQPQPAPAEAPTAGVDTKLSQEPIDAVPIKAEPAPTPVAPPKPKIEPKPEPVVAEPVVTPAVEPAADPGSCLAEIGEARAKRLVARCIQVSPATRPPCNSANPCALIQDEINRSCAMYGPDETKPKECAA